MSRRLRSAPSAPGRAPVRHRSPRAGRALLVAAGLLLQVGLAACGGKPQATDPTQGAAAARPRAAGMGADSGFRPKPDGFSFENYGAEHRDGDLTVAQARRMFGDQAACRSVGLLGCRPSLATEMWLKATNAAMAGGHCEGMAVLSGLVFAGLVDPARLGGEEDHQAFDLKLEGNATLQREISYYWATQSVGKVLDATVRGTPSKVLDALRKGLSTGEEQYTIGIYNRAGAGHAVTAFAVRDQKDGQSHIMVYDNNFPSEEKYIVVDAKADTWVYATAALNPSEDAAPWDGDAKTESLEITPLSVRLGQMDCPYCSDGKSGDATDKGAKSTVRLQGTGLIYVQDKEGRRSGQVDGKVVNEIPGVRIAPQAGGLRVGTSPLIVLPADMAFEVVVRSVDQEASDATLSIVRRGLVLMVSKMRLGPTADRLQVAASGLDVSYTAGGREAPRIEAAVDLKGPGRDYAVAVGGGKEEAGGTIGIRFDPATEQMDLSGSDAGASSFDVELKVQDDASDEAFIANDVALGAGATGTFDLTDWKEGEDLVMGVDADSDGEADSKVSLDDAPDSQLFSEEELAEEAAWAVDDETTNSAEPIVDDPDAVNDPQSGTEEPGATAGPGEEPAPGATEHAAPGSTHEPGPGATDEPGPGATDEPGPGATDEPGPGATDEPAPDPTDEPAPDPTDEPAPDPTDEPAPDPTDEPEPDPTDEPEPDPTEEPAPWSAPSTRSAP